VIIARHPHLPSRELWPTLTASLPELRYPETLNLAEELVDRHVAEGGGERTAIRSGDRRVSYRELQTLVNRIANGLRRAGVSAGDRVAMRFPNRIEFAATWLAVQKIGAVGVSTMPLLRARELAYIANDSEAKVFICAADRFEELAAASAAFDHSIPILLAGRDRTDAPRLLPPGASGWLEDVMDGASDSFAPIPVGARDVALIAYTSGSTGTPKGATHAPADVLASADTYARHILGIRANDVLSGHPTLAFTFGLGGLLVFPLRFGASSVLVDPFTPDALLQTVGTHGVTILFCAATTYRILLQDPQLETRYDFRSLRLCVSAGETLPAAVYREWVRRTGVEILDGIGSTEMFHIFISARAGSVRAGATGTVVPGYEARVVDDQLNEVPRGSDGLLAVRGPTGCRYWRKAERQREYVRGGWNLTGDVYRQDEDGYFWYQCRNDDLIICGGYNIAGPEVEAVLLEHDAVLAAAVVASPDPVRAWIPKAFVVLKPGRAGSAGLATELQEHVKRALAPYKYPREVEFIAALPTTETGKVRRVELREREIRRKQETGGGNC
jgi:2-aminobenzoate-CoA ligase